MWLLLDFVQEGNLRERLSVNQDLTAVVDKFRIPVTKAFPFGLAVSALWRRGQRDAKGIRVVKINVVDEQRVIDHAEVDRIIMGRPIRFPYVRTSDEHLTELFRAVGDWLSRLASPRWRDPFAIDAGSHQNRIAWLSRVCRPADGSKRR